MFTLIKWETPTRASLEVFFTTDAFFDRAALPNSDPNFQIRKLRFLWLEAHSKVLWIDTRKIKFRHWTKKINHFMNKLAKLQNYKGASKLKLWMHIFLQVSRPGCLFFPHCCFANRLGQSGLATNFTSDINWPWPVKLQYALVLVSLVRSLNYGGVEKYKCIVESPIPNQGSIPTLESVAISNPSLECDFFPFQLTRSWHNSSCSEYNIKYINIYKKTASIKRLTWIKCMFVMTMNPCLPYQGPLMQRCGEQESRK